jgi:hypothetical protein
MAAQLGDHGVQRGQQHLVACALELQGMAGVVDVFAGAGKVHEFLGRHQLGTGFELGLDPVLDGLDVVVGGLFNGLDGQAIGLGKVLHQPQQVSACSGRKGLEFVKSSIAQGNEPGHLHLHTAVHIALFTHEGAQGSKLGGVAAIQWGEG